MADEPRQDDRPRGRMAMRWPVEIRVVLIGAAALVLYHAVGGSWPGAALAITFMLVYLAILGLERVVRR
jgi:asparagine N-glycosylation enzyme membrane subunit Stt3